MFVHLHQENQLREKLFFPPLYPSASFVSRPRTNSKQGLPFWEIFIAQSNKVELASTLPRLTANTIHRTPSANDASASQLAMPPPPNATTFFEAVALRPIRPKKKKS